MPAAKARSAIALPTDLRRGLLPPYFKLPPRSFLRGARRRQGVLASLVDDLGVRVLVTAENHQPWTGGVRLDAIPNAKPATHPLAANGLFVIHGSTSALLPSSHTAAIAAGDQFDLLVFPAGGSQIAHLASSYCRYFVTALLRYGLTGLATDDFAVVADALALVRFRLANGSHFGGELADLLLVRSP